MAMTPRIVFVCDTCETVYFEHEGFRGNRDAAQPCIADGHNVYASGVGRLELPTVKRYLNKQHQPTLF